MLLQAATPVSVFCVTGGSGEGPASSSESDRVDAGGSSHEEGPGQDRLTRRARHSGFPRAALMLRSGPPSLPKKTHPWG